MYSYHPRANEGFRDAIFHQLSRGCRSWVGGKTMRLRGGWGGVKSEGAEAPTAVFFSEVGVLSAVIWRVAALSKGRGEKGMLVEGTVSS